MSDKSSGLPTKVERDNECQLCRLLDYRDDEINEPEGIATIPREDGGTKTIHCCERCPDELWDEHDWTPYESIETDGGEPPGGSEDAECDTETDGRYRCVNHECNQSFDDPAEAREHERDCSDHWITDTAETPASPTKQADSGVESVIYDDINRFGTWYLIFLPDERVINTFHKTDSAVRKRENLIEHREDHTPETLVIDGVPLAAENRATDLYDRVSEDGS